MAKLFNLLEAALAWRIKKALKTPNLKMYYVMSLATDLSKISVL